MSKRWTLEDDQFLCAYADAVAGADWLNHIASHDLGHHGKNAGKKRMEKLIETGVYDKIRAYHDARSEMADAWGMAFGPASWRELIEDRRDFEAALKHPVSPTETEGEK